jgi:hypothetical protein
VDRIVLTPSTASLVPAQPLQLQAEPRDAAGNPLTDRPVTWSSNNPAVATVSETGLVASLKPGSAGITATSEGKAATAQLAVKEGGYLDQQGGTISAFSGAATLVVPAGALAGPTAIQIDRLSSPPLDATSAGSDYSVSFSGTMAQPAALSLTFNPNRGPAGVAEANLGIRRLGVTDWEPLGGSSTDVATHTTTGEITQAGSFGVGRIPPNVPCVGAKFRQFDFWLGRWDVAPTGSPPTARQADSHIAAEAGGCAIFEDFRDLGTHGVSISVFDPATDTWNQTYVDNNATRLVLTGSLVAGEMILDNVADDSRIVWSQVAPDRVRQVGQASNDGGQTFPVTQFDLEYKPK